MLDLTLEIEHSLHLEHLPSTDPKLSALNPGPTVTHLVQHGTPLFIEHFEETGSGSLTMMNGGSSRNVILMWNFSGTPCGGTCICD